MAEWTGRKQGLWLGKTGFSDWAVVQFHVGQELSHSEFHPFNIKVQVTFNKEIAVH